MLYNQCNKVLDLPLPKFYEDELREKKRIKQREETCSNVKRRNSSCELEIRKSKDIVMRNSKKYAYEFPNDYENRNVSNISTDAQHVLENARYPNTFLNKKAPGSVCEIKELDSHGNSNGSKNIVGHREIYQENRNMKSHENSNSNKNIVGQHEIHEENRVMNRLSLLRDPRKVREHSKNSNSENILNNSAVGTTGYVNGTQSGAVISNRPCSVCLKISCICKYNKRQRHNSNCENEPECKRSKIVSDESRQRYDESVLGCIEVTKSCTKVTDSHSSSTVSLKDATTYKEWCRLKEKEKFNVSKYDGKRENYRIRDVNKKKSCHSEGNRYNNSNVKPVNRNEVSSGKNCSVPVQKLLQRNSHERVTKKLKNEAVPTDMVRKITTLMDKEFSKSPEKSKSNTFLTEEKIKCKNFKDSDSSKIFNLKDMDSCEQKSVLKSSKSEVTVQHNEEKSFLYDHKNELLNVTQESQIQKNYKTIFMETEMSTGVSISHSQKTDSSVRRGILKNSQFKIDKFSAENKEKTSKKRISFKLDDNSSTEQSKSKDISQSLKISADSDARMSVVGTSKGPLFSKACKTLSVIKHNVKNNSKKHAHVINNKGTMENFNPDAESANDQKCEKLRKHKDLETSGAKKSKTMIRQKHIDSEAWFLKTRKNDPASLQKVGVSKVTNSVVEFEKCSIGKEFNGIKKIKDASVVKGKKIQRIKNLKFLTESYSRAGSIAVDRVVSPSSSEILNIETVKLKDVMPPNGDTNKLTNFGDLVNSKNAADTDNVNSNESLTHVFEYKDKDSSVVRSETSHDSSYNIVCQEKLFNVSQTSSSTSLIKKVRKNDFFEKKKKKKKKKKKLNKLTNFADPVNSKNAADTDNVNSNEFLTHVFEYKDKDSSVVCSETNHDSSYNIVCQEKLSNVSQSSSTTSSIKKVRKNDFLKKKKKKKLSKSFIEKKRIHTVSLIDKNVGSEKEIPKIIIRSSKKTVTSRSPETRIPSSAGTEANVDVHSSKNLQLKATTKNKIEMVSCSNVMPPKDAPTVTNLRNSLFDENSCSTTAVADTNENKQVSYVTDQKQHITVIHVSPASSFEENKLAAVGIKQADSLTDGDKLYADESVSKISSKLLNTSFPCSSRTGISTIAQTDIEASETVVSVKKETEVISWPVVILPEENAHVKIPEGLPEATTEFSGSSVFENCVHSEQCISLGVAESNVTPSGNNSNEGLGNCEKELNYNQRNSDTIDLTKNSALVDALAPESPCNFNVQIKDVFSIHSNFQVQNKLSPLKEAVSVTRNPITDNNSSDDCVIVHEVKHSHEVDCIIIDDDDDVLLPQEKKSGSDNCDNLSSGSVLSVNSAKANLIDLNKSERETNVESEKCTINVSNIGKNCDGGHASSSKNFKTKENARSYISEKCKKLLTDDSCAEKLTIDLNSVSNNCDKSKTENENLDTFPKRVSDIKPSSDDCIVIDDADDKKELFVVKQHALEYSPKLEGQEATCPQNAGEPDPVTLNKFIFENLEEENTSLNTFRSESFNDIHSENEPHVKKVKYTSESCHRSDQENSCHVNAKEINSINAVNFDESSSRMQEKTKSLLVFNSSESCGEKNDCSLKMSKENTFQDQSKNCATFPNESSYAQKLTNTLKFVPNSCHKNKADEDSVIFTKCNDNVSSESSEKCALEISACDKSKPSACKNLSFKADKCRLNLTVEALSCCLKSLGKNCLLHVKGVNSTNLKNPVSEVYENFTTPSLSDIIQNSVGKENCSFNKNNEETDEDTQFRILKNCESTLNNDNCIEESLEENCESTLNDDNLIEESLSNNCDENVEKDSVISPKCSDDAIRPNDNGKFAVIGSSDGNSEHSKDKESNTFKSHSNNAAEMNCQFPPVPVNKEISNGKDLLLLTKEQHVPENCANLNLKFNNVLSVRKMNSVNLNEVIKEGQTNSKTLPIPVTTQNSDGKENCNLGTVGKAKEKSAYLCNGKKCISSLNENNNLARCIGNPIFTNHNERVMSDENRFVPSARSHASNVVISASEVSNLNLIGVQAISDASCTLSSCTVNNHVSTNHNERNGENLSVISNKNSLLRNLLPDNSVAVSASDAVVNSDLTVTQTISNVDNSMTLSSTVNSKSRNLSVTCNNNKNSQKISVEELLRSNVFCEGLQDRIEELTSLYCPKNSTAQTHVVMNKPQSKIKSSDLLNKRIISNTLQKQNANKIEQRNRKSLEYIETDFLTPIGEPSSEQYSTEACTISSVSGVSAYSTAAVNTSANCRSICNQETNIGNSVLLNLLNSSNKQNGHHSSSDSINKMAINANTTSCIQSQVPTNATFLNSRQSNGRVESIQNQAFVNPFSCNLTQANDRTIFIQSQVPTNATSFNSRLPNETNIQNQVLLNYYARNRNDAQHQLHAFPSASGRPEMQNTVYSSNNPSSSTMPNAFHSSNSSASNSTGEVQNNFHSLLKCAMCMNVACVQCNGCCKVKYCSEICARTHWDMGHNAECRT